MGENKILQIWGLWLDKEDVGKIDYPKNYDIQPIALAIADSKEIREVYGDKSPTFVSENLKRLARRIEPKIEEAVRKMVEEELDKAATAQSQFDTFSNELRNAA